MRRLLAIGVLSVFALAGCGGGDGTWSQAQRDEFMNNCTSAAQTTGAGTLDQVTSYCQCTLDALEQKYTPAEVAELEQGSSTDSEAQAEIMDIVTSCLSEIQ